MLMVANHYHFLSNRYPGTGGLYNYVKYIFGYDRAFLAAWFLFLIYIAIFWANATSIPLFARYFLGSALSFGKLYTVFGYDVYLGEILVTFAVIFAVALLCMKSKKATARSMVALSILFTVVITVCFVGAMTGHGSSDMTMAPAFVPDKSAFRQVIRIAFISPWAFIGFESVSHSAADKLSVVIIVGLFGMSIGVLLANYISMRKWEKKATEERDHARSVAYRDPLTGVKSKNAFAEAEESYDRRIESDETIEFAVIVCVVNGLKHINDTLGHKAGDDYIRASCDLICVHFKHSPVFRIGGDEFVVILEGQDYENRSDILNDINAVIESHVGTNNAVISLGLSEYDPAEDTRFHDAFKRADGHMYERKMKLNL